ncbi:hypothetical protein PG999_010906 [Apiospora kogelbergensis]|uniref:Cytochrome P450 n=1 Tax=Apiospora kogelbergensis TaxID=1337665 RepID=A0AAW0QCT5_9PEZI
MIVSSLFSHIAIGLSLILTCLILKRRYAAAIRDIPGPFFASFTGAWQVYKLITGDQHVAMIELHRKHVHEVDHLPDHNYVNQMSECDPKEQIRKSRNVNPGYALSNVIRSEPQVDELIRLLEHRLDECINAKQAEKHAGIIDLNRWLTYFTFDVLGEVTFSQAFGFLAAGHDIRGTLANSRYLIAYLGFVGRYPALHHATLGNPLLSRLGIQPTSHIFDTVEAAMADRTRNPHVRRDMMAQWEEVRATRPDRMAADEAGNAALANVGAGGDTTSATIQACLHFVVNSGGSDNVGFLHRLREEIDGAQDRGELSETISFAETQKLPYLQACIKETYRCHPAFGSAYARIVPSEGFTVGDRKFSSGTVLGVNAWVINTSRSVFGADADTFNPDRWLDAIEAKRMGPYLMHWGTGYNQCPGRNLANLEACKVVAQLVRDYDIEPVQQGGGFTFSNRLLCLADDHLCRLKRRGEAG